MNKRETIKKMALFLTTMLIAATGGCAEGVSGVKWMRESDQRFDPYQGKPKVYWKEHGVPADPNSYIYIGTISGRSTWCGVTEARLNEKLHQHLINQAARHGGDGIILYCGELGSVGDCYCYGDVIRFKASLRSDR